MKNVDQATAKNHANAWRLVHDNAEGLGVTAQREVKRANKLIQEAQEISVKALGRRRAIK